MIEIPEARTLTRQLSEVAVGKRIKGVEAAKHPHKFAWYFGDPQNYHQLLTEAVVEGVFCYGGLVEIELGKASIVLGDGVRLGYYPEGKRLPAKHQLHIEFDDAASLVASVQMYGGIWAFPKGQFDNPYYMVAKKKPNPFQEEFDQAYFNRLLESSPQGISLKAFLATEQRIPGLGNGTLQDILFNAGLHPKKKLKTLKTDEINGLFSSVKGTLKEMTEAGGRDTEKDLFDHNGGYSTLLSKHTVDKPCSRCGDIIKKEAYLGGSIYYCPTCQQV